MAKTAVINTTRPRRSRKTQREDVVILSGCNAGLILAHQHPGGWGRMRDCKGGIYLCLGCGKTISREEIFPLQTP